MTRIVTTSYCYERLPRKRKAVAPEVPAVVTTKKNRHPAERAAAEVVSRSPRRDDGAAQPTHRAMRNVTAP
jgi:hypothetical protein